MGRFRAAQVVGGLVAAGAMAAVCAGVFVAVSSAQAPATEPAVAFALDYGAEYDRVGAVATAAADRDARVAETARIAAEQAAAVEAARVADEAAIMEQSAPGAPVDPAPEDAIESSVGGLPAGAVPPSVPGSDQPDSTACASSSLVWDGTQSVCA